MNRPLIVRAAAVVLLLVALAALGIPAVFAVPPANDDFDSALVVGGLPFNDAQDTREATVADDDPSPFCGGRTATVWYAFTPASDQRIEINTAGSSYPTSVSVYTGTRGALGQIGCGGPQLGFSAAGGGTYYIMIGSLFGGPYPGPGGGTGGDLVVSAPRPRPPTIPPRPARRPRGRRRSGTRSRRPRPKGSRSIPSGPLTRRASRSTPAPAGR